MFLRPFLKYFKPFIFRLVLAVIGTVLVGTLAAVPLLIAREALQVLMRNDASRIQELEQSEGIATGMKSLLKGLTPAEQTGVTTPPPVSNTAGQIAKPRFTNSLDHWLENHLGRAWTGPRNLVQAAGHRASAWYGVAIAPRIDAAQTWYRNLSRERPLRTLGYLVVLLIVLTAVKGLAEFTSKYQLTHTFFFTNLRIREDIFGNVLHQDYLFFSRHSAGYLYSRINSDVKDLRDILEGLLSDGIQQPITLICMFSILLWLSVPLTIGVMFVLPLIGGLLYYFAGVLRRNARKQKQKADELSSSLTESLNNIRLVKAFGTEPVEIGKFHERSMALFRYMMARRLAKFGSSPLMESLGSLAVGGVILLGGWMIMGSHEIRLFGRAFVFEKMAFADFVIFLATLSRFYRPIRNIAMLTNKYQTAHVSVERMTEMLNLKPKIVEDPDPLPFSHLRREVEFRRIGFSYGRERVLSDVNLRVAAGSRVAFAGPSGSGKTTLINLLVRLFDPTEGQILIDGEDLRRYNLHDWRRRLAIVTQDTYLFDDTVANNIAYGSDEIEPGRVEAAARAANAHEFILELEGGKGYESVIGPMGTRLSGGQRQRLAIARALYRDPRILVLDEATSALDSQSQALVQSALSRLMEGRTTFIVAHRISTIRNVDCIYVLDDGRIAERGSHDALVAQGGLYAAMVSHTHAPDAESLAPAEQAVSALNLSLANEPD